jgi:hypothetical protein
VAQNQMVCEGRFSTQYSETTSDAAVTTLCGWLERFRSIPQSVVWAKEAYECMAHYGRGGDTKHSGGLREGLLSLEGRAS